jgi:protease secretion system membrane fusion protein
MSGNNTLPSKRSWLDMLKGQAKVEMVSVGPNAPGEPDATLPLPSDTTWSIRVGMLILLFGFGGFFLWAWLAPLDEGVPAPGMVMVEGKRKTVQHLSGGVVKELLVQEAKLVKAGDILMRLDDTIAKANFDAALQNYYALLADEARLLAEQKQAKDIQFSEQLLNAQDSPERAKDFMQTQRGLFMARRAALQGDIAVLEETLVAQDELAKGLQEQISYLRPQLEGMRDLAKEGFLPRNRQLEMERQYAELQANAARAKSAVAAARLNLIQRKMDFREEVETRLADVRRELSNAGERVRATREELERITITAPAEGSVTGLMVHTVGGVVAPGQKLMDIVPQEEGLILEIQIPSHLIDRLHAGMPADITFQSFVNLPNLVIDGKLLSVSADVIADHQTQQNQPPYFLGRVEVTPEGMKKLGSHQMQPGMPASVVIKTGSRSLFDYLLKPLKRRLAQSLTEA